MAIIEVDHLTKEYRLGQVESLKTTLFNQARRLVSQPTDQREQFKALDNLNFSIDQGEIVGIIGHNGAGKSTLLKIISRITSPTAGTVRVKGRIAPLIEVGAGLVPELTGRENIYLNGSILGLSRKNIDSMFEEIVEFAEIEEFIDTPIKRYSSGMKVKLAFSVATTITAEILIVDEVLAVGDLAFQRKCFNRMEDIIKKQGRTVLFVSHNIRQIERMCKRVMMLEHGEIIFDGKPSETCQLFYRKSNATIQKNVASERQRGVGVRSSGEVDVLDVCAIDESGTPTDLVPAGSPLRIRLRLQVNERLPRPEVVIGTHTTDFFYITSGTTAIYDERPDLDVGNHTLYLTIPDFPVSPGVYCIRVAIFDPNRRNIFFGENLSTFTIDSDEKEARKAIRLLDLPHSWQIDNVVL